MIYTNNDAKDRARIGETRIVRRFAILPKTLHDDPDKRIWWEWYLRLDVWRMTFVGSGWDESPIGLGWNEFAGAFPDTPENRERLERWATGVTDSWRRPKNNNESAAL